MKYLQDYIQEAQTQLFKKYGILFVFSDKQYKDQKVTGVTYVSLGAGLVCPKNTAKEFIQELELVHIKGIKDDIIDNGIQSIIERELNNHEFSYTQDITSTIACLRSYPITEHQVYRVSKGLSFIKCAA